MAKISARGDKEIMRFKREDGAVLVLTARGRLLRRFPESNHYNVIQVGVSRQDALRLAAALDYKAV